MAPKSNRRKGEQDFLPRPGVAWAAPRRRLTFKQPPAPWANRGVASEGEIDAMYAAAFQAPPAPVLSLGQRHAQTPASALTGILKRPYNRGRTPTSETLVPRADSSQPISGLKQRRRGTSAASAGSAETMARQMVPADSAEPNSKTEEQQSRAAAAVAAFAAAAKRRKERTVVHSRPRGQEPASGSSALLPAAPVEPALVDVQPAGGAEHRMKSPREVQVCLNCTDRPRGFVRSVTACTDLIVPQLRRELHELQARSKFHFTYAEVEQALKQLREQFARGKKRRAMARAAAEEVADSSVARPLAAGKRKRKKMEPVADAEQQVDEEEKEVEDEENDEASLSKTAKRKRPRRAHGSAMARALKEEGRGLFRKKKCSPHLRALLGVSEVNHVEVMKLVWAYIKDKGLRSSTTIVPDAALKTVCPADRFEQWKLAKFLKVHLQ
mmetsp:Transcript_89844/g.159826  ORF Transcript_89844/g.159826 Transcript_89844/m.159826 type:complete len:440 (-) Transcript_89844:20-1339(-)